MDSGSDEDVPKILSPELHDVFPIIASMLDITSFINLAMTCKDTYKRCTEDKTIKINVNVGGVSVGEENGSPVVYLSAYPIRSLDIDTFVSTLRKLPCRVNTDSLVFLKTGQQDFSIVDTVVPLLKEIGVETVRYLSFREDFTHWEAVVPFIPFINLLKEVCLNADIPPAIKREFLNLDIQVLWDRAEYFREDTVSLEMLLENGSAIPKISFAGIRTIDEEQLNRLLSKIESGSLRHVTVHSAAIDWNDYDKLPFDYDGPLPDERALLLARTSKYLSQNLYEYWILHPNGFVTKCVVKELYGTLEIFKCEPWEYPWILRKEEDVLKDLAERRPQVLCTAGQFKAFTSTFESCSAPSTGDLPDERPLYFPVVENNFLLLTEDDSLMKCKWEDDCATWKPLDISERIEHLTLAKFRFWKLIEKCHDYGNVHCKGAGEFNSWFDDFNKLDFDYLGDLPRTRPLVFERTSSEDRSLRVVLFEDRVVECEFLGKEDVIFEHCSPWNLPSILITSVAVKRILQRPLERYRNADADLKEADKRIPYDMFLDGFKRFKKSPCDKDLPEERPLIYQKMTVNTKEEVVDERWYTYEGIVRKAMWKEGRFLLSPGGFREFPTEYMKELFRMFAERDKCIDSLLFDYDQFNKCLEQFTVVPFDYSGTLKNDTPLAFVKKEIRHTCRKGPTRRPRCKCTDFYIQAWFLWDGLRMTSCFWDEKSKNCPEVTFEDSILYSPPVLSSKQFLRSLLQGTFAENMDYKWCGLMEDLRAVFDSFKVLRRDYDGPLPDDRPLVFDSYLF